MISSNSRFCYFAKRSNMLRKKEAIERRNSLLCKASVTIQTPWVSGCITQIFIKFLRICSLQMLMYESSSKIVLLRNVTAASNPVLHIIAILGYF
jgi:hypothetical protein